MEEEGGKGRVDITQILISTVEINARFWSLINARDSVQHGSRSPVHPHRWIRASSQDIAPSPSILPSFLPFSPFSPFLALSSFPAWTTRRPKVSVCVCVCVCTSYLALPVLISHEANVRSTRPTRERGGHLGAGMVQGRWEGKRDRANKRSAKCLRGYRENSRSCPFFNPGRPV